MGRSRWVVDQEGDWVHIWVHDNGPGIPAAEQERIFEKFTRLEGANLPKGFGLGLAYCRLAVQAHGGRIWVESEPGMGARFIFTLPVAPEGSFPVEETPPEEIAGDEATTETETPIS